MRLSDLRFGRLRIVSFRHDARVSTVTDRDVVVVVLSRPGRPLRDGFEAAAKLIETEIAARPSPRRRCVTWQSANQEVDCDD